MCITYNYCGSNYCKFMLVCVKYCLVSDAKRLISHACHPFVLFRMPFCLISDATLSYFGCLLSYFGRHIVLFRMPVVLFRTPHCLISDACCLISDAFCLISDATLSYFRCVLLREIRQSMPISQNNQILSP